MISCVFAGFNLFHSLRGSLLTAGRTGVCIVLYVTGPRTNQPCHTPHVNLRLLLPLENSNCLRVLIMRGLARHSSDCVIRRACSEMSPKRTPSATRKGEIKLPTIKYLGHSFSTHQKKKERPTTTRRPAKAGRVAVKEGASPYPVQPPGTKRAHQKY